MVLLTATIVSHSTSSILKQIAKLLAKNTSPYGLLSVLSPSPSLPDSHLSDLVTALTAVPNSVGCISSCLPLRSREPATSVALAVVDASVNLPWRSTIPGRGPMSIGRSHSVKKQSSGVQLANERRSPPTVSEEIRGLRRYALPSNIDKFNPDEAQTILYLSDHSPEGLSETLSSSFPEASQLGLLTTATPFLTGRPFTLFRHSEILSDGAVGFCLPSPVSQFDVMYPHLTSITDTLTVSSVEGNLVHSLDDVNPAKLMISAMEKHNMNKSTDSTFYKEDQFYIGVLDGNEQPHRLHRIISGGPSRGIVSLEGEDGPARGSHVKIYHLPSSLTGPDRTIPADAGYHAFHFLNLHPESVQNAAYLLEPFASQDKDGTYVLENTFLAASEYGCLVKRPRNEDSGRPWRFSVPNSCARLMIPMAS